MEVAEDVTIPSFNASIDRGHNNVSVTIRGAGKLTVTNEFISTLDNLVILSDVSTTCTFKVANLTFGAEDGSVAPELYILVDGAVNGVETNTFSDSGYNGMDWKLYSGTVTLENKQAANPAFSMNTAGDSLYIGVNATLNSVGFVAAYGTWDGAQNNYRVEVYGTFNAYGTNQTPPNVVS